MRTAAALVIGNELLTGKIQDANVLVLARTLRGIGVLLRRVVMVLDELDTIASEVRALADSHDVVFTSGGVGPTHDDVTIAAISKAFGVDPVRSPDPTSTAASRRTSSCRGAGSAPWTTRPFRRAACPSPSCR